MLREFPYFVVVLIVLALLAAVAPATAEDESPATFDFSGRWVLNADDSDDPTTIMARGRSGGPGGQGRGGGMDRAGGRGVGGRGGGDPKGGGDMNRGDTGGGGENPSVRPVKQLVQEIGRLDIFHEGDEFNLTDGMDISRVLRIGGEAATVFTPRGAGKASAAWVEHALEISEQNAQGELIRKRRIELVDEGERLFVTMSLHLPGQDSETVLRLFYDREAESVKP